MANLQTVTSDTFNAEVQNSALPVLVDFYADWCGPCKQLSGVLEKLAAELAGQVSVVKINVDENSTLSQRYSIMNLPTIMVFRAGQPVETVIGYRTLNQLKELVLKHVS